MIRMTVSSEFYDKVFLDFPDGFLMSPETDNPETRPVTHVYDIKVHPETETGNPRILLLTLEDIPGKVYDIVINDYEIIENDPRLARITVDEYELPMLWSDNLSDELRIAMHNERIGGVDLPDELDPPNNISTPAPDEESAPSGVAAAVLEAAAMPDEPESGSVTITPEQANASPELQARAIIGDLLKDES